MAFEFSGNIALFGINFQAVVTYFITQQDNLYFTIVKDCLLTGQEQACA